MVNFPEINPNQKPYHISNLITSFRQDTENLHPPDLIFTPAPINGDRYPIRVLVIGIPTGVDCVIGDMHAKRFADIGVWSPGLKSRQPGEIMKIMTRYVVI